jgi:hypothetical protein
MTRKVMKYVEPEPITRDEVSIRLASNNADLAAEAIIRMALWESEWEWAERVCLLALKNDKPKVKVAALTAIGHVARRFRTLHLDVVLPAINELHNDTRYKGAADDALDDIAVFIPNEAKN